MKTEKEMFELSFKRPRNYFKLHPLRQWTIDEDLGILDWVGNDLTNEERERFNKYFNLKK